eukprot:764058-Hanusia_phi.AAC.8
MSNNGKTNQKARAQDNSELSSKMRVLQSQLQQVKRLITSSRCRSSCAGSISPSVRQDEAEAEQDQRVCRALERAAIQKEIMLQSGGSKDSDMASTQDEIKNLLLDLLKDPEFRAMMLKAGLSEAMNELLSAENALTTDETQLTKTEKTIDHSHQEEITAGLARSNVEGKKVRAMIHGYLVPSNILQTVAADTYNVVDASSKVLARNRKGDF